MSRVEKIMDLRDFVRLGFLQEANRRFFHPHGLALCLWVDDETGGVAFDCILDCREEPAGMVFQDMTGEERSRKAAYVKAEYGRHLAARTKLFLPNAEKKQYESIQPIGHKMP